MLEFLDLPEQYSERNLRKAITGNLKQFILEFGKDFTFIGQINFYLEALGRDVKKPNENPSVGVILCAGKDDAVVEYALSRSMSPTLVV